MFIGYVVALVSISVKFNSFLPTFHIDNSFANVEIFLKYQFRLQIRKNVFFCTLYKKAGSSEEG